MKTQSIHHWRKRITKAALFSFTYTLIFTMYIFHFAWPQAPNAFTFQGVARDAQGKIIANSTFDIYIEIKKDSPDGLIVFASNLIVSTNSAGVFTSTISTTASSNGKLDAQTLSNGNFFLSIKMLGGEVDLGVSQLSSVPFSLVANKLPDLNPISQVGELGAGEILDANFLSATSPTFVWYPRKNAFKVGTGLANEESLGQGSIALGTGVIANTSNEIALGTYNALSPLFGDQTGRLLQVGNGTSGNDRRNALTILKNGRIGVGNNVLEPTYLLDVGGRARIRQANNQTAGIYFNNNTNVEAGFVGMRDNSSMGFYLNNSWMLWVNSEGEGHIKGQLFEDSDYRLKRDFSPLTKSLTNISNLSGQHYYWVDKAKSQKLQTGLIAQEVEKYFPELVSTDENGFKAVNYIGLIPHLIESVKALKSKTEELAALEQKFKDLDSLRAQVDELRTALKVQASSDPAQTVKTK